MGRAIDTVEIRLLTPADVAVLDRVDAGVFDHAVQRPLAERYLASPDNVLAVAIDAELVVGMASAIAYVHPDKPLQLFVNEVGVADRMRGRGIGKRLVGALLEQARRLGCTEVWVATEVNNQAARALYASLRGKEDGDHAVVYTWSMAD